MITFHDNTALPPQADVVGETRESDMVTLAQLLRMYTPYDGRFTLRIPGLHAIRASRTNTELIHTTYNPSLCIVAQGAKRMLLGDEAYDYDASRMLIVSVDVPVASQVTQANHTVPFLSFRMALDPTRVAELVLKVYPHGVPPIQDKRAIYVSRSNPSIVNAIVRLVALLEDAKDAELIAPLVIDEILIRLLRSPIGNRVAQIGLAESSMHKIAKAVDWLRANFAEPMNVETLAELVDMSVSSFHQHFKSITSMSPIQFQKVLRLQEARRLMVATMMDAGRASRQVGYLSASQFSREYSRLFGNAPTRDIAHVREHDFSTMDSTK